MENWKIEKSRSHTAKFFDFCKKKISAPTGTLAPKTPEISLNYREKTVFWEETDGRIGNVVC